MGMPAKRHLMAFRWRADDGSLIVVVKVGPLWQNFLDPRMGDLVHNFMRPKEGYSRHFVQMLHHGLV